MAYADIISHEKAGTIYGLFYERLRRSYDKTAYQYFCATSKTWLSISWQALADEISLWQTALKQESLSAGDRIAINLRNSIEWVVFDLATSSLGLILVPLYPDDRPDNIAYILQDADVKLLFLQNKRQWQQLQPALPEKHTLQSVIINHSDDEDVDLPAIYRKNYLPKQADPLLTPNGDGHELATIIYTSGTTGRPKGVMLSHQNMLSVAFAAHQYVPLLSDDKFLSFLPLSHTLERTAGYYLPMMAGSTVAFSRGIPQLADDMKQVQPSIMISVPRIFERIYSRLQSQLKTKSAIANFLFTTTKKIGLRRFQYQQYRANWHPSLLAWPLLYKLVAAKVHQQFGGNIRAIVSGGAALHKSISDVFIGLGFDVLQGYGLTETSPIISVNGLNHNYPASVGKSLQGISVKIGENDELLARGPGTMLGYWNKPKATAEIIDPDGWLHTGDQAQISDSGHIYITGRIKDILVMSNGEKVPPSDIEAAILLDDTFDQVLVIGEGQAFLSALIVLNPDAWSELAKQHQLDPNKTESLADKQLISTVMQRLKPALSAFPAYARIRHIKLYIEPWTIENGLLTPTMKIKRNKVIERYQDDINSIYNEHR